MIRTLPIVNSVIRQFCYQCLLFSTKKNTLTDLTDPKSALEFTCFYNFTMFSTLYFPRYILILIISGPINSENKNQYENMEIETQMVTKDISLCLYVCMYIPMYARMYVYVFVVVKYLPYPMLR